jgi:glycosyltransferase involved in cell wall biosynthesis
MYPPHHLGGYEIAWHSATEHLRAAGHDVRILTTDYRRPDPDPGIAEGPDVHRELRWYWHDHGFPRLGPAARVRLERANAETLRRHLAAHRPDVVAWWAMGGMSLALIEHVRRRGLPAVGFVIDDWMLYGPRVDAWTRLWAGRPRLASLAERATGLPATLDLGSAATWVFVSETTRSRALATGLGLPRTGVAHIGIDGSFFRQAPPAPWRGSLLYCGRIDERKGIDLAIGALELLPDAALTVAGAGDDDHLAELVRRAEGLGVANRVEFIRPARTELPALYAAADALLFPVRWPEPWGLVPLEAMAVGTPVVATGRGGSGEYLRDGENALLFDPDAGPGALADAVARLAGDAELRARLRAGGRATAGRFDAEAYAGAVAEALRQAVSAGG